MTKDYKMGNVKKLERKTARMQDAIATFERDAKSTGLDITREGEAPAGRWYCNGETNMAFRWFLSGMSYGECISR